MKSSIKTILCFNIFFCIASLVFSQDRNQNYINKYYKIAVREMNDYGIPASITLAQGILESAAGTSKLAVNANNHFGIKCHNDWQGESVRHDDDKRQECFRKYDHAEESFIDHSQFLKDRGRYSFLFELDRTDYKAWAKGLRQAGYATDRKYSTRLIDLIDRYDLHKYDTMSFETNEKAMVSAPKQKAQKIKNESNLKFVTIQIGESYYTIGKKHRVPFGLIYKYNDVDRKTRQPKAGDIVYLQYKNKKVEWGNRTHTVKNGESMHSISQAYGIKLHCLYDLNKMEYTEKPQLNQVLKLR